jgi:RHS repeat-associated protein
VYGEHVVLDELFVEKDCGVDTCYGGEVHNFLWGGSMHEPETDLYWMRNRYYHKGMKRFINQDPIGIWGDANNLGNGFAYVAGMVVEATDPTGFYAVGNNEVEVGVSTTSGTPMAQISVTKPGAISGTISKTGALAGGFYLLGKAAKIGKSLNPAGVILFAHSVLKEGESIMDKHTEDGPFMRIADAFGFQGREATFAQKMVDLSEEFGGNKFYISKDKETGDVIASGKDGNKDITIIMDKDLNKKEKIVVEGKTVTYYVWDPTLNDGKGGWRKMASNTASRNIDEDNYMDMMQSFFANQLLKKMLVARERKTREEMFEEAGPVIEVETDMGRRIFIFNPYYRGNDPMKEVIWRHRNPDGTWGFIRNPFAPGGDYDLGTTTYEKIRQKGFVQPEVDPYFN